MKKTKKINQIIKISQIYNIQTLIPLKKDTLNNPPNKTDKGKLLINFFIHTYLYSIYFLFIFLYPIYTFLPIINVFSNLNNIINFLYINSD